MSCRVQQWVMIQNLERIELGVTATYTCLQHLLFLTGEEGSGALLSMSGGWLQETAEQTNQGAGELESTSPERRQWRSRNTACAPLCTRRDLRRKKSTGSLKRLLLAVTQLSSFSMFRSSPAPCLETYRISSTRLQHPSCSIRSYCWSFYGKA